MALDDYFSDPSQDCLARLFDAVNSMDLSGAPILTRQEKLIMRSSERKDIFAEKFSHIASQQSWGFGNPGLGSKAVFQHKSSHSNESSSSFEDGLLMRNRERDRRQDDNRNKRQDPQPDKDFENGVPQPGQNHAQNSPSDSSFSLGGSAVWVGDESGLDLVPKGHVGDSSSLLSLVGSNTLVSSRKRRSTDASSFSSQTHGREQTYRPLNPQQSHSYNEQHLRSGMVKDTHFYHTSVAYKDHHLPIKMPLATFSEEVGDVGFIVQSTRFV